MRTINTNSTLQSVVLIALRFLIGWHLFYEGFAKLADQGWSSIGFLKESKWILEGFSQWIISNPDILKIVDLMNTWGLIAIGLGLILGVFTKTAAISGSLLLFIYYLCNPPLTGLEYSVPMEGNYLVVSKTLIESVALLVIALFPTSQVFGVDAFISRLFRRFKKEKN